MSDTEKQSAPNLAETDEKLEELLSTDSGAREVVGWTRKLLLLIALLWALFQIAFAGGFLLTADIYLRPIYNFLGLDNISIAIGADKGRYIHLTFALLLVFMTYPAFKGAPKDRVPWYDWILLICGAATVMYSVVLWDVLQPRAGNPTLLDMAVASIGLVVLLEATRRSLGPPLVIIASIAILYMLFGNQSFLGAFAAPAKTYRSFIGAEWSDIGIFGTPLSVSMNVVFIFVLFGALLEKAGAGSYFIRCAFASLGFLRGGPAKAAVVASGLTGLISGSSIANTVTTGVFTIPMMKKVGFKSEKAGAVEVSSSVNGQLMPPVMGAAAFLMEAYIPDLAYQDIVKHAFLPAIISYIALVYIVHLEACKNSLPLLERDYTPPKALYTLARLLVSILTISVLAIVAYYIVDFTNKMFGKLNLYVMGATLICIYVALVWYCSRFDSRLSQDVEIPVPLPKPMPIFLSGLYYLLPVILLVWCLMILRLSTGKSAFWASTLLIFIMITQRPLLYFFRGRQRYLVGIRLGLKDVFNGLISGSRGMVTIALATATAGIVVAMVTQTGIGNKFSYLIVALVGDNIMLILIATAVLSLILGMGLPTTANYIIVSTLMVPVVIELGGANGLIVPMIAAHMFCFYFGIMADVTPPVGLASIAASAISKGDPLKTGGYAFYYSLRTAVLPFMFIFNTKLLLWNVGLMEGLLVAVFSTVAILIFTAALQGWFITKNKFWETLALMLVAFTLFQPRFWLDQISPRFTTYAPSEIMGALSELEEGEQIRLLVQPPAQRGSDFVPFKQYHVFDLAKGSAEDKLAAYGIEAIDDDGKLIVDFVLPMTEAEKARLEELTEILSMEIKNKRIFVEIFWIPAILLLIFVYMMQKTRSKREEDLAIT